MATVQGQYKGKDIYAGSDADIQKQMQAIDAGSTQLGTQAHSASLLQQAQTLLNSSKAPAPITPQQMQAPAAPYQAPPQVATPVAPPDMNTLITEANATVGYDPNAAKALQDKENSLLGEIEGIINKQATEGARTAELENQLGVPDLNKNLTEIQNQIKALNAEAFQQVQNQEGRLAPMFGIVGEQERIQRLNSARQYGLAATAQAMQGSLALAQDSIERAIKAEFGGLEARLKYQELLLNLNRDKLSAADQKKTQALELALTEKTRLLQEQQQNRTGVYEVMTAAAQNGAPANVMSLMQKAQTPEQALAIASQYGVFIQNTYKTGTDANGNLVEFQLDPQGKVISSRVLSQKAPSPGDGSPGSTVSAPYGSDDYWLQLFNGSKGGKSLTGEQTTPLTKASIVLTQVSELAEQIKTTDTDPILGILRDNNPYDVKARLIQAQLRATVPNLARGVYGEVGVLTDTDIANYIQTLPNIRTPEEANNLILGMTLRTIQNSFRSYLETYAASGRDVSGFVPKYQAISDEVKRLTTISQGTQWGAYEPVTEFNTAETTNHVFSSKETNEGLGSQVYNFFSWLLK